MSQHLLLGQTISRVHSRSILLLCFLLGSPIHASTPTLSWKSLRGPFGYSTLQSMLVVSRDTLLVAGSNALYRSTDGGITWSKKNAGLSSFHGGQLFRAPGGWLLLYGAQDQMHRSSDCGETWSIVTAKGIVNRIELDPTSGELVATPPLQRSTDYGSTWNLDSGAQYFTELAISPATGHYFRIYKGNVERSTDKGATWAYREIYKDVHDATHLLFDGNNTLFAGTLGTGLYHSFDEGASWTEQPSIQGMSSVEALSKGTLGWLYCRVSQNGDSQLCVSTDHGESWKFLIHTSDRAYDDSTGRIYTIDGAKMQSNSFDLLYSSTDFGNSWRVVNNLLDHQINAIAQLRGKLVAADYSDGLWTSTNQGLDWIRGDRQLERIRVNAFQFDAWSPARDSTMFVATSHGLYQTKDLGSTVDKVTFRYDHAHGSADTLEVTTLLVTPRYVYLGTWGDGIYRWDRLEVWSHVFSGVTPQNDTIGVFIYSLAQDSSGHLLAGTERGFLISYDSGRTWSRPAAQLPDGAIRSIVVTPKNDVFAAVYESAFPPKSSVYLTTNLGTTWHARDYDIRTTAINSLTLAPAGQLIAGFSGAGVWISSDDGVRWTNCSQGMSGTEEPIVFCVYVAPDGHLYAGTRLGVMVSDIAIPLGVPGIGGSWAIRRVPGIAEIAAYPNPFVHATTIAFTLDRPSTVSLEVYDEMGRRMDKLIDQERVDAGSHRVEYTADPLSRTSYCVLTTNGERKLLKLIRE